MNVLVRSHYLPLFSRLGPYRMEILDDLAYRRRDVFEAWAHEASILPTSTLPLIRWRMHRAAAEATWGLSLEPDFVERVIRELQDRGPLGASELGEGGKSSGAPWGWSRGKHCLEWLFVIGRVAVSRRRNFERVYDLIERVLPEDLLRVEIAENDARRALLEQASSALGIATARDLADYFRMSVAAAKPQIDELVEQGDLLPVTVEGWRQPAYLHKSARLPAQVHAAALLSPFDSLIWSRERTQRLFDFHYRIEIYVPAPKRLFGYYVLPFLFKERLVGRVDLKSDRARGVLMARAVHYEPEADTSAAKASLREELRAMANWLGLEKVEMAST